MTFDADDRLKAVRPRYAAAANSENEGKESFTSRGVRPGLARAEWHSGQGWQFHGCRAFA